MIFKILQDILMFQEVVVSMADTFLHIISPLNPKIAIYQPPMVLRRQLYLWMMSDALLD